MEAPVVEVVDVAGAMNPIVESDLDVEVPVVEVVDVAGVMDPIVVRKTIRNALTDHIKLLFIW